MICLLNGCRLNGALHSGDPLLRLNAEGCHEEHKQLEREGRRYARDLEAILRMARKIGIIERVIDLSTDPTHLVYWGRKMIKRWGTVFSTMHNRAMPGLLPLTGFDLASGLFLYIGDFIGKARRDRRGKAKDRGKIVARKVMKCIDLLKDAGIRVRSLTGDEGMVSGELLNELEKEGIAHLFALSARSKLRELIPTIERWKKLDDGRLIGIVRNVAYKGVKTNLVVISDERVGRTFLYVSSYGKGARYIWGRYCRRGRHENGIGVAKSIGLEDGRPSTNLFQIKGHALACIYLLMLLKVLCERLNLGGGDLEPRTIWGLLTRECYVRWENGRMIALVVVTRTMLARIGTSKIEWDGGTIELLWHQTRRGGGGGRGGEEGRRTSSSRWQSG
jgi:hypothetical protein